MERTQISDERGERLQVSLCSASAEFRCSLGFPLRASLKGSMRVLQRIYKGLGFMGSYKRVFGLVGGSVP